MNALSISHVRPLEEVLEEQNKKMGLDFFCFNDYGSGLSFVHMRHVRLIQLQQSNASTPLIITVPVSSSAK